MNNKPFKTNVNIIKFVILAYKSLSTLLINSKTKYQWELMNLYVSQINLIDGVHTKLLITSLSKSKYYTWLLLLYWHVQLGSNSTNLYAIGIPNSIDIFLARFLSRYIFLFLLGFVVKHYVLRIYF